MKNRFLKLAALKKEPLNLKLMLENLIKLVQENAGEAIVNNNVIPNEKNNEAISSTANSIFDTLKSQVDSGNTSGLMDMFTNGNSTNNNITNAVSGNVITDLMKKFGLDNSQASGIAGSLIPKVMGSFVSKTNDPNDKSFDLQDIMKNLSGSGNVLSGLTSLFK